jgi:hypothetical protein
MSDKTFIELLHARYEASWVRYNELDNSPTKESCYEERAMQALIHESDLLRSLILLQPITGVNDAAILAYHLSVAHDLVDEPTAQDVLVGERGHDSLFNWLRADAVGELGAHFSQGERLAQGHLAALHDLKDV